MLVFPPLPFFGERSLTDVLVMRTMLDVPGGTRYARAIGVNQHQLHTSLSGRQRRSRPSLEQTTACNVARFVAVA
jgi:hypothetical protein